MEKKNKINYLINLKYKQITKFFFYYLIRTIKN